MANIFHANIVLHFSNNKTIKHWHNRQTNRKIIKPRRKARRKYNYIYRWNSCELRFDVWHVEETEIKGIENVTPIVFLKLLSLNELH